MEIAVKTKSWSPVSRNGWIVKFSIYRDTFVLISMISEKTDQYIVRQFTNEDDACTFINYVVELDSSQVYDL